MFLSYVRDFSLNALSARMVVRQDFNELSTLAEIVPADGAIGFSFFFFLQMCISLGIIFYT